MQLGMLYAALAYATWGLIPIYFKMLQGVAPDEILAHRIVWSLLFLALVLAWRRQWAWLRDAMRRPKVLAIFSLSAVCISVNWLVYIWSVANDRVVDASLGYFINPLVSVLLGFFFLHERLRLIQWLAVGLAGLGVAWLAWQSGQLPWNALALAFSFGAYGLLRKIAPLGTLEGLTLETLLLLPLALGYLFFLTATGQSDSANAPLWVMGLLWASGPLTAIPLLWFAAAARRIPLSLLGLMQYIAPSLQLLLGVWLYHEPFGEARIVGFTLIWSALALYSLESLWRTWAIRRRA